MRETAHPERRLELPAPGRKADAALGLAATAALSRKADHWRVDLAAASTTAADREMILGFEVVLPAALTTLFCTDDLGSRPVTESGTIVYRGQCGVPAITFYGPKRGVTLVAPFEVPAPGLTFRWKKEGGALRVAAEVANLRLPAGGKCRAALFGVAHEGDWRPALGWIVRRYPEYFRPPNPGVVRFDGPMIYDFVTPEERLRCDLGQDLAWQELGWYWPHLGLYLPDGEQWRRQPGSDGGLGQGGAVTRTMLTDFIHRATRLGIGQFLYFQSTESWAHYAEERFPESRTSRADGTLIPTWIKCVVMNPDPAYPFGKHIARQAGLLMDAFPEMAGFFWDQNCYAFLDHAHDDGISMEGGRPVSMIEFAQNRLLAQVTPGIHARGKAIFSNGAYTVGLARYVDGIMSEGTGSTRRLQYLCMMKPLCLLSYDSNPAGVKEKVLLGLETGAQPAVTLGSDACRSLYAGYRAIFRLLRGKEWVFHPRALELPPRWRGNLFRNARGDYVATLVPPVAKDAATPMERLKSAPVRVRLPRAEAPRAAYLLSPDAAGLHSLPMERQGEVLGLSVPQVPAGGVLLLARRGVWVAASQPALVAGESRLGIEVANLRPKPLAGEIRIQGPGGAVAGRLALLPYARHILPVTVPPSARGKVRLDVQWSSKDGGKGGESIEVPVRDPVEAAVGPAEGRAQVLTGEAVEGAVTNRSARPVAVTVTARWEPQGVAAGSWEWRLAPGEAKALRIPVGASCEGACTLRVETRWPGGSSETTLSADVLNSFLPAGFRPEDVEGATLSLDAFNSLGGQWTQKPLLINGVRVGTLPVTGQTLRWHEGLAVEVAAEATRKAVAAGLQADGSVLLRVVAENAVHNCFKVRNVRVVLRLQSGALVSSTWSRQARCSDPGWLYTEGQSVPNGQPVPLGDVRLLPKP